MCRTLIDLLVIVTAVAVPAAARAGDGPELTPLTGPTLPVPTPVPPAVMMMPPVGVGFYRPNRYDVWQTMAVDRTGHWRPRVAVTGYGAWYVGTGQPYGLLPVRQIDVLPYLFD